MDNKLKIDIEFEDKYKDALKALLEADKAIQLLTPQEKYNLYQEYVKYKASGGVYDMLQQHYIDGRI